MSRSIHQERPRAVNGYASGRQTLTRICSRISNEERIGNDPASPEGQGTGADPKYPVGRDHQGRASQRTRAKGMGIKGKLDGMNGALAPVMWAEGKGEEVLRYVAQDVRTTMELATTCESRGELHWVARSGKVRRWRCRRDGCRLVMLGNCPSPDTSWMSSAWPRERFTGWMGLPGRT